MPPTKKIEWIPLKFSSEPVGRLAIYKSSQSSILPVRAIDRRWDNKSDPNLETSTWGLFSTCMPATRKGIVDRGDTYIFFFTTRAGGTRQIMGYYELGSYVATGFRVRDRRGALSFPDFAIRAKRMHFVEDGLTLNSARHKASRLKEKLDGNSLIGYGPRLSTPLSPVLTRTIKDWLDNRKDCTSDYVKNIKALEERNFEQTKFRYPSWEREDGFEAKHMGDFVK